LRGKRERKEEIPNDQEFIMIVMVDYSPADLYFWNSLGAGFKGYLADDDARISGGCTDVSALTCFRREEKAEYIQTVANK